MTCTLHYGQMIRLWAEGPDTVPLACSFLLQLHAEVIVQSPLNCLVINCLYIISMLSSVMLETAYWWCKAL